MTLIDNSQKTQDRGAGQIRKSNTADLLGFTDTAQSAGLPSTAIFALQSLDKSALEPMPIDPDWILEGAPQAMCKNLSRIGNDWTVVDHWSCTAGKFRWHYYVDETILILEGEAFIRDRNGVEYHAVPGKTLSFPDGSSADWHVPDYIRKIAFNQKSVPDYLHWFCDSINRIHRKLFK